MASSREYLSEIAPVSPPAPYQGGKRNLAARITRIIEAVDHDGYAEPFVGMGGIFLRRRRRPRVEVINDISGDVVTLFRVLAEHYPYVIDMLRFRVSARAEFQRLLDLPPHRLTDLQRAVRFLYLQRLAFGGKISGRNFGVDSRAPARWNVGRLEQDLAEINERLQGVTIEQLPFGDFIRRYDRAGMLFYLDPPYWGCETDYGQDVFARGDFERLAEQLGAIAGKFILSINAAPEIRDIFAAFEQVDVATNYSIGSAAAGQGKRVGELLISNFPLGV